LPGTKSQILPKGMLSYLTPEEAKNIQMVEPFYFWQISFLIPNVDDSTAFKKAKWQP
jgi:hypothetical protein